MTTIIISMQWQSSLGGGELRQTGDCSGRRFWRGFAKTTFPFSNFQETAAKRDNIQQENSGRTIGRNWGRRRWFGDSHSCGEEVWCRKHVGLCWNESPLWKRQVNARSGQTYLVEQWKNRIDLMPRCCSDQLLLICMRDDLECKETFWETSGQNHQIVLSGVKWWTFHWNPDHFPGKVSKCAHEFM